MKPYIICCISHNRHENVTSFLEKVGTTEVVFFVKDQTDAENYKANGAEKVVVSGSLMHSRNAALDYCFAQDKTCVQLSDDLVKISVNDFTSKRTGVTVTVCYVLDYIAPIFGRMENCFFAGFPPTDNPFFSTKVIENNKFIVGDFIMVKPNPLRFDINLRLKEDYDYTLQHIKRFRCCARFGKFLCSFKHYSNKGGAVSYRDSILEKETIQYLMNKWKGCFKLNPKRENEILIKKDVYSTLHSTQIKLF